jgi:hypothetical protein
MNNITFKCQKKNIRKYFLQFSPLLNIFFAPLNAFAPFDGSFSIGNHFEKIPNVVGGHFISMNPCE